ncbi:MAG: hypothetical protein ACI3ZK_06875 [Candidatus Cryptobacteroides sp.]
MKIKDNLVGLLITVSIHLAVIIVLLVCVVEPKIAQERSSIELDFTKEENIEKIQDELRRSRELNEKLNQMLRAQGVMENDIKNVAVDRAALKDDRGTDAEELYREAERIDREYRVNMSRKDEDFAEIFKAQEKKKEEKKENFYTGPSVLSYHLEGRKGSHLPIPAYKCIGAGEVTVIITVDPQGRVLKAKVQEEVSSTDPCLREYALNAASQSRFSQSSDAPARQTGNIVYAFLAQ